jgi:tetratricopeptide (TPR) repeat protein
MRLVIAIVILMMGFSTAVAQDACSKTGKDSVETITKYSLYREFFKQKNFTDAIPNWQYVFFNAPGYKERTFGDGAVMYGYLVKKTKDAALKDKRVDTLLMIYDKRIECFGRGYGRKGIDLFQYRSDQLEEINKLFNQEMERRGNKADYFIFGPMIENAIKLQKQDKIDKGEVLKMIDKANGIIDYNVTKGGKKAGKYQEALEQMANAMPDGYLNCDEAISIFKPKYEANPDDQGLWKSIFNTMRSAKCTGDPFFLEVAQKYFEVNQDAPTAKAIAVGLVKAGKFSESTKYFKEAIALTEDSEAKAELTLDLAKVYSKLNDFPTARSYARKAAALKSGWGEPYMLIGDLYGSSGKLCGPGTGFDSQRVVWVAIDMYKKAKSVDPSVAASANKRIAERSQYMPDTEQGFLRELKEGDTYLVPCWINENTTVRFAK